MVKGGTGNRTVNADSSGPDRIVRIDGADLFDRFGSSVVPTGDTDGDGMPDFAVGAPLAGTAVHHLAGKVYFFKGMDVTGAATLADATVFEGVAKDQVYGIALESAGFGWLLIGAPGANRNAGAFSAVDLSTGRTVLDGSGGGAGGGGECP